MKDNLQLLFMLYSTRCRDSRCYFLKLPSHPYLHFWPVRRWYCRRSKLRRNQQHQHHLPSSRRLHQSQSSQCLNLGSNQCFIREYREKQALVRLWPSPQNRKLIHFLRGFLNQRSRNWVRKRRRIKWRRIASANICSREWMEMKRSLVMYVLRRIALLATTTVIAVSQTFVWSVTTR